MYVVESTGTVRSAEIKTTDGNNGQFFLVERGVKAGEKIVLEGVASLREGVAIKPRMVNADSVYSSGF